MGTQLLLALLYAGSPTLVALIVTRGRVLLGPWIPRRAWPVAVALALGPVVVALYATLGRTPLRIGPLGWLLAIAAPLGEELGWRGALGPWLERRLGWLPGALATGVAWTLWHIPVGGIDASFAVSLLAASVAISSLVWFAGGSLLVAILAHASLNLGLLRAPDAPDTARIAAWILVAAAIGAARARAARRSTPAHPDTAAPAFPPRP